MRIVVMSDSHGCLSAARKIVEKNVGHADMFIHLGDGEKDYAALKDLFPNETFHYIKGNCDSGDFPDSEIIEAAGVKIFCTHGHRYTVSITPDRLCLAARLSGCKIALYGHTHSRETRYEEGLYIMNPGSCSCPRDGGKPSFGTIEITDKEIITGIYDVP